MKSRFHFCAFLSIPLLVGLCKLPASAADWPMLGRDRTRKAVSPERRPPLDWSAGWNKDQSKPAAKFRNSEEVPLAE